MSGRTAVCARDSAVADVVGSMLTVGITVFMAVGLLVMLIAVRPEPTETVRADLALSVRDVDDQWGSGNEQVMLRHAGGQPLDTDDTTIHVLIGSQRDSVSGAALGSAFSDGSLSIGEQWIYETTVPPGESVAADIVSSRDGGHLVGTGTARGGVPADCSADLLAPSVTQHGQAPPDVQATSGDVVVTLRFADNCAGVDVDVDPVLHWRFSGTPAFADLGPMTRIATNTWSITLTNPGWTGHVGETLEYYADGYADRSSLPNTGRSATYGDLVQLVGTNTFVAAFTATQGSLPDFVNLQSASDSLEGHLAEGGTVQTIGHNQYATLAVGSGATLPQEAKDAPDSLYALLPDAADSVAVSGMPAGAGAITKVELVAQAFHVGTRLNDVLRLSYVSGSCTGQTDVVTTLLAAEYALDVTAGCAWDWSKVTAATVEAEFVKSAAEDALDYAVDALWLRVTTTGATYAMDIELTWAAVPAGALHVVELGGFVAGSDSFHVDVWDPAVLPAGAWVTRGATLSGLDDWSYTLTPTELNGGAPRIRIVDDTPTGAAQGTLAIGYARVVSA